jgi:hypothetical protein
MLRRLETPLTMLGRCWVTATRRSTDWKNSTDKSFAAVCNQHCWPEITICGYWDLGTGSLLEPTVVAHNSDAVKELLNGGHGVGYDSFGEIRLPNSISCKFGLKFFLCHFDRCKLRHASRYGFHLSLHLNVSFLYLHFAFVHFASHTVHLFAAKQDWFL